MKLGVAGQLLPSADAVLRDARRAEAAGWDSMWWADHLMGWYPDAVWTPDLCDLAEVQANPHVFLDPLTAMSATAVHTTRMALGTSVTDPIRRPPALLAQQFLSLHHLSGGRAVLGLGAGEAENLEPYGFPFDRPVARLDEALQVVRLLWEHDAPVDFDGEFWTLRDAVLGMGGYHGTFPPVWLAAHGPRMLEVTGRLADGWLPIGLPPTVYAEALGAIRDAAAEAGRDPGAIEPGVFAYCVLGESESDVDRLLTAPLVRAYGLLLPASAYARHGHEHPLGEGAYGLTGFVPTRFDRATALAAIERVPEVVLRDFLVHGTPDQVVDRLGAYAAAGAEHAVLWNISFFGGREALRPSFALLEDVRHAVSTAP